MLFDGNLEIENTPVMLGTLSSRIQGFAIQTKVL